MEWIDLKVRKPTEADANENGEILQLTKYDSVVSWQWDELQNTAAWMPIPEFTPIPDPPEGYRFADMEKDKPCKNCLVLTETRRWRKIPRPVPFAEDYVYAIPVKPKYRPFASAEEFKPYRSLWFKHKTEPTFCLVYYYNSSGSNYLDWQELFDDYEFEDGTPFGVKVE